MSKPDDAGSSERQHTAAAESEHPMEWDEAPNNRKPASDRQTISEREEKDDARKIVTGESKYTADYAKHFPDLAAGSVLRSDIAHGRVTEIDASAAEEMEGVYAVVTPDSEEVPDKPYTSSGQPYPEPSPWDLHVLRREVNYVGDPIAAVAAVDGDTADRATRAIEVSYEEEEGSSIPLRRPTPTRRRSTIPTTSRTISPARTTSATSNRTSRARSATWRVRSRQPPTATTGS